jgi:hypothetical protein
MITTFTTSFVVIKILKSTASPWNKARQLITPAKAWILMLKELREASPSENGSYAVATPWTKVDIYSDMYADESVEKVRYFWKQRTKKRHYRSIRLPADL